MSCAAAIFLLIALWASLQDGFGLPLLGQQDAEVSVSSSRARTRRCACSSLMDSECHYFCHLDIIWVNTAGKTTVYGLGSSVSRRRRRSTSRCTCTNPDDLTCTGFCQHRLTSLKSDTKTRPSLLNILRDVARRRMDDVTESKRKTVPGGRR